MSALVDVHREVHRKTRKRRTHHLRSSRVLKVHELHESVELVVGREWRVAQNVRDVRRTEHVETTAEAQSVERSVGKSEEVDVSLAERLRTSLLLRVDKQIVGCTHTHIHRHVRHIGEVYIAVERERIAVACEELEVLELHLAVCYRHRVVAESHLHTVRLTRHISRVEHQFAVHVQAVELSVHLHVSVGITLEVEQSVGHETIEQQQRSALQLHICREMAESACHVRTAERAYLVVVYRECAVDTVLVAAFARHVYELARHIANLAALVRHLVHTHERRHRHYAVVVDIVEVAVHHARHLRSIRNDGEHLGKVELRQADCDVLLCFGAVVAEHLHTHAVVCQQLHVSRYALVVGEEHIVALVHLELLVAEHRVDAAERHAHTVLLHIGFQSERHAETVAVVEHACAEEERLLVERAAEESVEDVLLVISVVAYLAFEVGLHRVRPHGYAYRVELHARSHERVDAHRTVDALHGRRVHFYICVLEFVTVVACRARDDVLLARIEING